MDVLSFKRVEFSDIGIIRPYLMNEKNECADYTCGLIMMWKDALGLEFAVSGNTLFLKGTFHGAEKFYLPCGNQNFDDSLSILRQYCDQRGIELQLVSIPKEKAEEIAEKYNAEYHQSRDYSDYIYSAKNLAELSGRAYHQKRNHISKFKKENPDYKVIEISEENLFRVKEFFGEYISKYPATSKSEETERKCAKSAIDNYKAIGLFGIFIEIDGKVCAFTFGEVKNDILFVHIEKADREINGSYPAINNEFVKFCLDKYGIRWVNREDDSGDEGLRKAKLSYRPDHLAYKGVISF